MDKDIYIYSKPYLVSGYCILILTFHIMEVE